MLSRLTLILASLAVGVVFAASDLIGQSPHPAKQTLYQYGTP